MPAKKVTATEEGIEIVPISIGRVRACILGTSGLIMNRFSKKAREELLLPSAKKNRAEKESSLKHDPVAEFRESVYRNRDPREPTLIHTPAGAFADAIASAALDMPGATKSQIDRLTTVSSTNINLYGIPRLLMSMVRSSDMRRTPDVRTRAIFPRWACTIEIEYVSNLIKEGQIINLLAAAGIIVGIGDWRSQKGGSHGKFRVVSEDDAEFRAVLKETRAAQQAALDKPVAFDADSEELLAWFNTAVTKREKHVPSAGKATRQSKRVPLLPPGVVTTAAKRGAARRNGGARAQ